MKVFHEKQLKWTLWANLFLAWAALLQQVKRQQHRWFLLGIFSCGFGSVSFEQFEPTAAIVLKF